MIQETILIVDGDPEMLTLLDVFILSPHGYKTIKACDGEKGVEVAIQAHPDLILVDMNLPRMNGLHMLNRLRNADCHSPVVLMTSYECEEIPIEAFRLDVRDYLVKPFTQEEVIGTIDRALRETRLTRDRDELNRGLLTAEAVRVTVVTLSHYLNNYLTSLKGGLALMKESLDLKEPDPSLSGFLKTSLKSALSIQALMKVLLETTNARLTDYTATTPMINIEDALRNELNKMPEFLDLDDE